MLIHPIITESVRLPALAVIISLAVKVLKSLDVIGTFVSLYKYNCSGAELLLFIILYIFRWR